MQNKSVVVRIDREMLNRIKDTSKTLGTTHSSVIRDALKVYYNPLKEYDRDIVVTLKDQISDLQGQRDMLQRRIDYFTMPWYKRLFMRTEALPDHKTG